MLGIDHWKSIIWLGGYFLLTYGLVFLLLFPKPPTLIYKLISTRPINDGQKAFLDETIDRIFQLCILLLIVFIVILASSHSYQKGRSLAEAGHKRLHNSAELTKPFNIVTITYLDEQNKSLKATGNLLQSSSAMFAMHTDGDDLLLIPASRLISIRYHAGRHKLKS